MRTYQSVVVLLVACIVTATAHAQTPVTLKPYTALYGVKYRGMSGGDIEISLSSEGNGRYTYSSHLLPNFLGSLFTSDQAEDQSVFQLEGSTIKPLKFRSEDGSKNSLKDIRYDFDWSKSIVNGHYKDQDFRLEVPAGVQDRLSIQLAASLALQAGQEPGQLIMIERAELQQHSITRTGTAQIRVAAGEFDTVVLKSERNGSSRSTRYWYAAKIGYLPVRAERSTKGKVDIVMELKSYREL